MHGNYTCIFLGPFKVQREYLWNEFSFTLTLLLIWRGFNVRIIFRWDEKEIEERIMFMENIWDIAVGSECLFLRHFQWSTMESGQMDIEIIAVSRYGCSRRLLGGRRIVLAVTRRMEIKLALFVRSPSVPTCDCSLLSFAYNNEWSCGRNRLRNCWKLWIFMPIPSRSNGEGNGFFPLAKLWF